MEYREFGKSGLKVSTLGLGTWPFGNNKAAEYSGIDEKEAVKVIQKYIELGGNFIDTARGYGERSERLIGQTVKQYYDRDKVIIATKSKAGLTRESIKNLRPDLEESLKTLQMDYVDLFQLHLPPNEPDLMNEVLDVMSKFKEEGKIRLIGASIKGNNVTNETEKLCRQYINSGRVDAIQVVYSILRQKLSGVIKEAKEKGVGVVVRTVLESGLLTGAFKPGHQFSGVDQRRNYSKENLEYILKAVEQIGKDINLKDPYKTLAQLAIKFSLQAEGISTLIIGAQEEWHVDSNLETVSLPDIDPEIMKYLINNYSKITEKANYS